MGMAASQARYLSLVARKSNVEYEGQQINQARTALSNQSANLFNQMLGLQVPIPPSTQDFTKTQYSYTDGTNASTITSWQQLGTSDPNYNYIVTHYYNTSKFTGSLKKLSNPQVQFSKTGAPASESEIQKALEDITTTYATYTAAVTAREKAEADLKTLTSYCTKQNVSTATKNGDNYVVTDTSSVDHTYEPYDEATMYEAKAAIDLLKTNGALSESFVPDGNVYVDTTAGQIAFKSDLDALYGISGTSTATSLNIYGTGATGSVATASDTLTTAVETAKTAENNALRAYNDAKAVYEELNHPTYIGNCELTPLASFTKDQEADIKQIIKDMEEQDITCNIRNCFDASGNYTGGIYTYQMNGQTYYTTLADLSSSYESTYGQDKPIENQTKLTYYNASYIDTKVEKTEKALLETDGTGRFTSVKFEDDSVKYTLNMETITDDAAYQDAMNQYYYDNAIYDKTVQDINAKTSIIQQEDQQLELKLKQLDTERQALTNEIDAVQKVVKDAVESGFKTFGS